MITIVAGEWKGRKLEQPASKQTRPTSNKVRGSIFNILQSIFLKSSPAQNWEKLTCADLFAGAGGLGFEALSRGASHCIFVDRDNKSVQVLQRNAKALQTESRCTILQQVVERNGWFGGAKESAGVDLIFADPPYRFRAFASLLEAWRKEENIRVGGLVVLEHDPVVMLDAVLGFAVESTRTIGPAGVSILRRLD